MDNFDLRSFAAKRAAGLLPQVLRDRSNAIGFFYRELRDRIKRWVLTDDGDVGAVKSRDDVDILTRFTQHLARDPRAGGVGNRVMTVEKLETVRTHDLVHAHGEGEVVRRKLEKWIAADIDFVEENSAV